MLGLSFRQAKSALSLRPLRAAQLTKEGLQADGHGE